MKETTIYVEKKPRLKNPTMVIGLPGIGNIGRLAVGYIVSHLKAKKFAELYSPHFFNFVLIHENKLHVLKNEFYYWKNPKKNGKDLVLLIGDTQSSTSEGHYEIAGKILEFASSLGVKEIIAIGGFGIGKIVDEPKVYAVPSDEKIKKKYQNLDVDFNSSQKIGTIIGAAGLVPGLAKLYGISGISLLCETPGYPIHTDPTGAEKVVKVLEKMLGIKVNLEELHKNVEEMHEFVKKLEELQKEAIEKTKKKEEEKELKYIG